MSNTPDQANTPEQPQPALDQIDDTTQTTKSKA
jgi:hypothetical protein